VGLKLAGSGFGRLLREYRLGAGMTQEELAERSGLSARAVADMERGRTRRPYRRSVQALADALRLPRPQRELLVRESRPVPGDASMPRTAAPEPVAHEPVAHPVQAPTEHADSALAFHVLAASDLVPPGSRRASLPTTYLRARPIPRQLPSPLPHFVGRSDELRELNNLLTGSLGSGATKVVAIRGTAGVGKTALAVYWAHRVAERFPDGQLFLNLNGYGPAGSPVAPLDAVSRLLEALQTPLARMPSSLDGRIGLYRSLVSYRSILIVLDNGKDADQVRPLLPAGGGCFVLVTSRSPMTGLVALDGARALNLKVFTDTEARCMVAARLAIAETSADSAVVERLIGACARLPLAMAIATALISSSPEQSLAGAAGDLTSGGNWLDALNTGEESGDLRSVFRWSYQALSPLAARMFRLLAEHPGPDIAVGAAASLAGITPAQARRALTELTDAHLVELAVPGRFAVHDLLRLYATEQLRFVDSPPDRRAAGQRMLDHYLHAAVRAAHAISPTRELVQLVPPAPGSQPEAFSGKDEAMAWLKAEHQVMMRATVYAPDAGFDVHAWKLAWALTDFLDRTGHWHDWVTVQRAALAAATRLGDMGAQAHAHRYLGRACFQLREFDEALEHLHRALELRRLLGDASGEAGVSVDLGRLHEQRGEFGQALRSAQAGLRLYRYAQHRVGEAVTLNAVGWYQALQGNYSVALSYCTDAVELCAQLGHKIAEGQSWDSLGYIHLHMGQSAQAVACYRKSVDNLRQIDHHYDESRALTHLGDAHKAAGDLAAARLAWQQALAILDDLDREEADQLRAKIIAS
jgi:tetratricopeptide (TPR) repeat protein/transcriptional regulator with XRE-family HTH domain